MSNFDLVIQLFLQLTVILVTCRIVTILGRRYLGQTDVVCEMIAGVMLGPSLLGLIAPNFQQWLFPKLPIITALGDKIPNPSMSILYAISQIGLAIYMFLIGLEFNTKLLKHHIKSAGLLSASGIITPFILGAIASFFLYQNGNFFQPKVVPWSAALYLGASMTITAFPMLARILYERGLAQTRFGTLALGAASVDDGVAWCLLAIVLASVKNSINIAILAIGGGICYILFAIFIGQRLLKVFTNITKRDAGVSRQTLTLFLIVLMFCAWFTDITGIYAIFGAFVLGAVTPRGEFAQQIRQYTEFFTTSFLLPIFFVFSGLNTQIGLVNTPALWGITILIVAIAVIGKGIACMLAAKLAGENWRESAIIGTLMNARGLMELIILNIGLEQGIITPTLFTIMVIMAIVTTLMASPLVAFLLHGTSYEKFTV
ncbi:potassium transporter [Nostoc linckia z18]|jgi:Kef-type K+ transport system membrane component KefB|uniref:Potassium transporter n=2 Tax=Nostoc linckia TaxID=92942 RepID=A0A9Q5Z6F3_NOSLI|nr:cation:proton antiporter [Nostoc linckia]PHK36871.1 potassium transporter [Nostoc linckia z15]PHK45033.1 potassium transporter [Nostoc linckia z16]PHJ68682.1 potassium transporter [Nostoc linckia z1]PHJ70641.1 potassium transporter [Nostoc linckia z3]PHJ76075.1 potassium transporter [Nostoc linckia z2]